MKSYLKQDNVAPPTPHNFILFELDFDIKFPLLIRLLLFLSDLKSTMLDHEVYVILKKIYQDLKIKV